MSTIYYTKDEIFCIINTDSLERYSLNVFDKNNMEKKNMIAEIKKLLPGFKTILSQDPNIH